MAKSNITSNKEKEDKQSKTQRILDMYTRLNSGKLLKKSEEATRYGVDERSIQRDIDDLRAFIAETDSENGVAFREIKYDRVNKAFYMTGASSALMSNSEILAVSKILLSSRALSKESMNKILDKLVAGCVPQKNMKLVTELLANEKFHYVELRNTHDDLDLLWEIGKEIREYNLIEVTYNYQSSKEKQRKRIVQPIAIMFSEYYFYLNAYIVEQNANGEYVHKYDYPAIFRVDRIESYKNLKIKFKLPYANRFEEGEFRKRVQFMYPGKLQKIQFKYKGDSPEPILDRLPTAEVKKHEDDYYLIEAEAYGKGMIMWLLSQCTKVEVVRPLKLREEIKSVLMDMLNAYM